MHVPYLFGNTVFLRSCDSFSFQNNPKSLDLSFQTDLDFSDCFKTDCLKTDLDFWDYFGRKMRIIAKFHRTDLVI